MSTELGRQKPHIYFACINEYGDRRWICRDCRWSEIGRTPKEAYEKFMILDPYRNPYK